MAPKPFNPPRPKNAPSTSSSMKIPSQSAHRKSLGEQSKSFASESQTPNETRARRKESSNKQSKSSKARSSTARAVRLPSLSPLTSDLGEDEIEDGSQEEDEAEYGSAAAIEMEDLLNDTSSSDVETSVRRRTRPDRLNMQEEQASDENEESNEVINAVSETVIIPHDLISVLLNEILSRGSSITSTSDNSPTIAKTKVKNKLRMTKQAVGAVTKYLDTFVREAVARAAWEGIERGGSGQLDVEDLERLAPQLVLDF